MDKKKKKCVNAIVSEFCHISTLQWSKSLLYYFIYDNSNVKILVYQLLRNASFNLSHCFE